MSKINDGIFDNWETENLADLQHLDKETFHYKI
jgi:hypothetical protein